MKTLKILNIVLLLLFVLFSFNSVFGQDGGKTIIDPGNKTIIDPGAKTIIDPGSKTGGTGGINLPTLENPLGNISTIPALLNRVATQLIILAAPLLAIMIIWGALNILTAAGDPGKVEKGKKIIIYSCIGFAIILVSKGIAAVIQQILK